jgi:hypothetical protein
MPPARIPIRVECYAGYTADERPVAFAHGERRIRVQNLLDRWLGEDHAYFKLVGDDGVLYIIRQDRSEDAWELILMEVPAGSPGRGGC